MYILGISCYYHDSAACLLYQGKIIAAVQEERFTRIKNDNSFPSKAIRFCINTASISAKEIDHVVFYEKPFLKFERLLETYLAYAPKGFKSFSSSIPIWIRDKLFQRKNIIDSLNKSVSEEKWDNKLLFFEHHLSHASSAFYPSPFERAAVLTVDAVGEWATTSMAIGKGNELDIVKEINFPHSLGLLYSAFTYYAGFEVNSGEYKLMGLAPYGQPKYVSIIKDKLIDIKSDGSFKLNMDYFDYCTGTKMTNEKFNKLFGGPPRSPNDKFVEKDMDLAASIQKVLEEVLLKILKSTSKDTGEKNLCLAGGVALNCVANGLIYKENIFEKIWIQPAAGDAGGSIGASLGVWYKKFKNKRTIKKPDSMQGAYLGPSYSNSEIKSALDSNRASYRVYTDETLYDFIANSLKNGKTVGWMQGRMEFGPRSLGNRSILADPRNPEMQKNLNLKIKYRESFRPFAPSVLKEEVSNWFEYKGESAYMLYVSKVKSERFINVKGREKKLTGMDLLKIPRSTIPAVTHVDYSARLQTVCKDNNTKYYKLIKKFNELTGVPILVNTSFNIRDEPIVCSPNDAYRCFMGTELDLLVIENFVLQKDEQIF